MKVNPRLYYDQRVQNLEQKRLRLKRTDNLYLTAKLIIFFAGIACIYEWFANKSGIAGVVSPLLVILFIAALVRHEDIIRSSKKISRLLLINRGEIDALNNLFSNGIDGAQFADLEHAYTSDLDIFGHHSLFHLVNRAGTSLGQSRLVEWFSRAADKETITGRQAGIEELSTMVQLRQEVQTSGLDVTDSSEKLELLKRFLQSRNLVLDRNWVLFLITVLPILSVTAIALLFVFSIPGWIPLSMFVLSLVINMKWNGRVSQLFSQVSKSTNTLKMYAFILAEIEAGSFQSQPLVEIKKQISVNKTTASFQIKQLASLVSWFDLRASGTVHFFVNNLLFWDLHCIRHIEKWRSRVADHIPAWFSCIAEFEAFGSLANLRFNQPDWNMPDIVDGKVSLKSDKLGHPLIPEAERINNSYTIEADSNAAIHIITGPNMAGKSTFLRTVGINMVLAQCGAPVPAASMTLTPVQVITSMKVSDSLDKHLSLFYAELQRLRKVLNVVTENNNSFFLIDEMLKGTNEADRQRGSIALIKQLIRKGAVGIVATHDLELTNLAREFPQQVKNFHFDGNIRDDKLIFDYILKSDICRSFNALILMKKIGIDIDQA